MIKRKKKVEETDRIGDGRERRNGNEDVCRTAQGLKPLGLGLGLAGGMKEIRINAEGAQVIELGRRSACARYVPALLQQRESHVAGDEARSQKEH